MNSRAIRRGSTAIAALSASAMVIAGCSSSQGSSTDPDGEVTLTIATFNNWGYTDELLAEYSKEHPNVTVVLNKAAGSDDARANYFQKLGKKGLADIEAIEIDWVPEVMKYSDLLAPVPDDLKSRWLDWKVEAATDADGNPVTVVPGRVVQRVRIPPQQVFELAKALTQQLEFWEQETGRRTDG